MKLSHVYVHLRKKEYMAQLKDLQGYTGSVITHESTV